MQLFRGYVPTKDKQCLEKFKGRKRLNTFEDVQDLDEYAAILGDETILIDVDDGKTSDLLFEIVQDLDLKCRVYKEYCIANNFQALSNIEFSRQVTKRCGLKIVDKWISRIGKCRVFVEEKDGGE